LGFSTQVGGVAFLVGLAGSLKLVLHHRFNSSLNPLWTGQVGIFHLVVGEKYVKAGDPLYRRL